MANSYFAKYHAIKGTMIGGVKESQTSRFRDRKDAEQRLGDTIAINGGNVEGEIIESNLPPEIFVHCGNIAQAIRGKCHRCGKELTTQDAKDACGNFEIGEEVICEPDAKVGKVISIQPEDEIVYVVVDGKQRRLEAHQVCTLLE